MFSILSHRNVTVEQENDSGADVNNSSPLRNATTKRKASKSEERPEKIRRFELTEDQEENNWSLNASMAEYVTRYMSTHVRDIDIKDKVLVASPVPVNVPKIQVLDGYMKELLVENNRTKTIHNEKLLRSIQEKIHNVMGPLLRLWSMTENELQWLIIQK